MDFDRIIDRRTTECIKWNFFDNDVLPMWVADTDFTSPPAVMEALHERVNHGIFGYGCPPAGMEDVITSRMNRLHGWQVAADQVGYVPGIVSGFNAAIRALCEPGGAVIYQTPAYPPFIDAPLNAGSPGVQNPMPRDEHGRYYTDFDLFERQVVENKVRMFILCNPQNPTGRVFSREELQAYAEICLKHDVIICSDEIHCDFVYNGRKHIPIASLDPEVSRKTLTFIAPSKTYNIAGLHASVVIIQDKELRERYDKWRSGMVGVPGVLAMTAARAAYEHGDNWLAEQLAYLQGNRDYIDSCLGSQLPGVSWSKPEATFLGWLDCSKAGIEGSLQNFFVENARVGLNDGLQFGEVGAGFVRMNFGTQRANIETALGRMAEAIKKI